MFASTVPHSVVVYLHVTCMYVLSGTVHVFVISLARDAGSAPLRK